MKAELKSIEITMSIEDGRKLQDELRRLFTVPDESEQDGCSPDEEYPKLNEFLSVFNVLYGLPF